MKCGRPVIKRAKFNGKRLQMLRIQRGMSARALGESVGLAESTVRHTEAGRTRPAPEIVEAFARLFGVKVATFR